MTEATALLVCFFEHEEPTLIPTTNMITTLLVRKKSDSYHTMPMMIHTAIFVSFLVSDGTSSSASIIGARGDTTPLHIIHFVLCLPSKGNNSVRLSGIGRGNSSNNLVVQHFLAHFVHRLKGHGGSSRVQEGLHCVEVSCGQRADLRVVAGHKEVVQLRDGIDIEGAKRGNC